jgi:hypothetical protein
MSLVITKEAATAAVRAELARLDGDPKPWWETKLLCAIEAIRRGDHSIALDQIFELRRGPTIDQAAMTADRPLLTRERLQKMLEVL